MILLKISLERRRIDSIPSYPFENAKLNRQEPDHYVVLGVNLG